MLLGLTVVVLLAALGVAGHRLTEYEWPWPSPRLAKEQASPELPPDPVLGASRTVFPPPEVCESTRSEGMDASTALEPEAARLPDYSVAIPDGCEDLDDEDIPLDTQPEAEADGEDLEEYLDKLDELALRVSFLVTGQLKNELLPALREWIIQSGLAGDQNLKSVVATAGPPDLDEEEIAARNRYFLELYEQATNQPD